MLVRRVPVRTRANEYGFGAHDQAKSSVIPLYAYVRRTQIGGEVPSLAVASSAALFVRQPSSALPQESRLRRADIAGKGISQPSIAEVDAPTACRLELDHEPHRRAAATAGRRLIALDPLRRSAHTAQCVRP